MTRLRDRVPRAVRDFVRARFDRGSALGLRFTIGILACLALIWAFSGVLEEVLDAEGLVRWDARVERWLHLHATSGGMRAFTIVTQFGSPIVWTLVAIVALLLWRRGDRRLLTFWLAANLGGELLQRVLKLAVHRHRPPFAAGMLRMATYSFPSGHAMSSTICYGALAYVLLTRANVRAWPARVAAFAAAGLLVAAVCLSRLYLGVHYPSDVAGGVLAGGAWLGICWTAEGSVWGCRV